MAYFSRTTPEDTSWLSYARPHGREASSINPVNSPASRPSATPWSGSNTANLSRRIAAIDIDRLAGDEAGRGRGEEDQDAGDVRNFTQPAERGATDDLAVKLRLSVDQFAVEIGNNHR